MKIKEVIKRNTRIDATALYCRETSQRRERERVSVYVFAKKCPLNFYYTRRRRFLLESWACACAPLCAALRIHARLYKTLWLWRTSIFICGIHKFELCLRDRCLMHIVCVPAIAAAKLTLWGRSGAAAALQRLVVKSTETICQCATWRRNQL